METIIADPAVKVAAATRAGVARAAVLGRQLAAIITEHQIPAPRRVETFVYTRPKIAGQTSVTAYMREAADLFMLAYATGAQIEACPSALPDRFQAYVSLGPDQRRALDAVWAGPLSGGAS